MGILALLALHGMASDGSLRAARQYGDGHIRGWNQGEGFAMTKSITAVVAAGSIASAASAQQAVQWRTQDGGNGHWYALEQTLMLWSDARQHAESRGGHLATIRSAEENAFILMLAAGSPADYFLGGYRENDSCATGVWRWITGEPFSYERWRVGEPDCIGWACQGQFTGCGTVLEIYARPDFGAGFGLWGDESPSVFSNGVLIAGQSVVEWSADCNADGIVDYGQIQSGDLIDLDGDNIPDCCEQGVPCEPIGTQWSVDQGGNGHWYALERTFMTWPAARQRAIGLGGHLATVTSPAENAHILALASDAPADYFLGAYRAKDSCAPDAWTWITGEPFLYAPWGTWGNAEPDCIGWACQGTSVGCGTVLEIIARPNQGSNYGRWADESPTIEWKGVLAAGESVIEWSADCNGDGVTDYGQIRAGILHDANSNYIPDCCETGDACRCASDVDGNGEVNGIDLAIVLDKWGTDGGPDYAAADVNRSGTVNGADLAMLLNSWGPCP
jgi:hypothetical protein